MAQSSPPQDHHRALCAFLLQGPRGALFFRSEVTLQALGVAERCSGLTVSGQVDFDDKLTLKVRFDLEGPSPTESSMSRANAK